MGKAGLVAVGLVLATCLAGCTPLQFEASDRVPGANATIAALPKYADNLREVEGRQEWADQKVFQYLNGQGAAGFHSFAEDSIQYATVGWLSPVHGVLAIVVDGSDWIADGSAARYAERVITSVGYESMELDRVEIITVEGQLLASDYRANHPGRCKRKRPPCRRVRMELAGEMAFSFWDAVAAYTKFSVPSMVFMK